MKVNIFSGEEYQSKCNEIKTYFAKSTGINGAFSRETFGETTYLGKSDGVIVALEVSAKKGIKFVMVDTVSKVIREYVGNGQEIASAIRKNFTNIPSAEYCELLNAVTALPVCSFCGKDHTDGERFILSPSGAVICNTCLLEATLLNLYNPNQKMIFHPAWEERQCDFEAESICELTEKRERYGLSKTQVAKAIGVDRKRIARIETGRYTTDYEEVVRKYQCYLEAYEESQKAS